MREFLVVFAVILLLVGLTAIKYRRQLMAMIGFARLLSEARDRSQDLRPKGKASKPQELVRCNSCGVWIPETRAVKKRGSYLCSTECSTV